MSSSPAEQQAKRRRSAAASNALAANFDLTGVEASSSSSQPGMSVQASTEHDKYEVSPFFNRPRLPPKAPGSLSAPVIRVAATRSQLSRQRASLRLGSCSLDDMLLSIPQGLAAAEHARRKEALQSEIAFQEHNPPVLPPSQVPDLPPKPFLAEYLKFPDDITDPERIQIEKLNNEIAAEHQKIDRERNNQAAKKSRQARLESLNNTRVMLNEKTAECAWFRMKVLAMGGSTADWDNVSESVRARLVEEIGGRVQAVEEEAADAKKKDDARKRADRNKLRAEIREEQLF